MKVSYDPTRLQHAPNIKHVQIVTSIFIWLMWPVKVSGPKNKNGIIIQTCYNYYPYGYCSIDSFKKHNAKAEPLPMLSSWNSGNNITAFKYGYSFLIHFWNLHF